VMFGGSQGDTYNIQATGVGVVTQINAGGGIDGLDLGASAFTLENIRGPVIYDGQTGGGNILLSDGGDATGDIAHLTSNSIGAIAGDTLFGPGGYLTFANIADFGGFPAITMNLGSGADTVY